MFFVIIFSLTLPKIKATMAETNRLIQEQSERQLQKLTPQQVLLVRLTEMSIADLEERVKNEMSENEALEEGKDWDKENDSEEFDDSHLDEDGGEISEDIIREGEFGSDDDTPDNWSRSSNTEHTEPQPIGDTTTFLDDLMSQMMNYDLTEHQEELLSYLIGSLNDNGFLDQSLARIEDEMLFNHGIETNSDELQEALSILQQFDPAGIGARNIQECFLIQIDRLLDDEKISDEKATLLKLERRIIADEFEDFENKNYEKVAASLSEDLATIKYAIKNMVKHLNPRPGLALCESSSDRIQTAIPDFIVETDGEGGVSFQLNHGDVPMLHVSDEYRQLVKKYLNKGDKISRHDKEGLIYYRQKIDSAQSFIDAIRQRQDTLISTMKAIIALQKPFFLSQDDEDLGNLIYNDVAEAAHLDISTVSRVCKTKYALVDGHMYPLNYFFRHNRKNSQGEEVNSSKVQEAIRLIIDNEDKHNPLNDDQLVEALKKAGINIARRTVNKYRKDLAIPSASKRKS